MKLTSRALAFASRWFDAATVDRVFAPLVADWQREWIDATPSRRSWVITKGAAGFALTFIVLTTTIVQTKAPAEVTNRAARRMAGITLLGAVLLSVPYLYTRDQSLPIKMFILAIPGMLLVGFQFSVISAVDAIRRFRVVPPQIERATALKLALVSCVVMLVFGGWMVPAANELSRIEAVAAGKHSLGPNVRELNTYELVAHPERANFHPLTPRSPALLIRTEINLRIVGALVPVLLIWLRFRALDGTRRAWYAPLPSSVATLAAIVGYALLWFGGIYLELTQKVPMSLGVWLPVLGLLAWGLAASYRRRFSLQAMNGMSRLYRLFQNSRMA